MLKQWYGTPWSNCMQPPSHSMWSQQVCGAHNSIRKWLHMRSFSHTKISKNKYFLSAVTNYSESYNKAIIFIISFLKNNLLKTGFDGLYIWQMPSTVVCKQLGLLASFNKIIIKKKKNGYGYMENLHYKNYAILS